jgi:hypothetical protein
VFHRVRTDDERGKFRDWIRDQYAWDVSDVVKSAFLRTLAGRTGRSESLGATLPAMTDARMDSISNGGANPQTNSSFGASVAD